GHRWPVGRGSDAFLFHVAVVPGAHERDFSDLAGADDFAGLLEMNAGALHRAGLHDPAVLSRGLDHLAAFFYSDADRFLDVDIFAVLAGFDGHVGVPVIGRGNADNVDAFVVEDFAEIGDGAGGLADGWLAFRTSGGGSDGLLEVG